MTTDERVEKALRDIENDGCDGKECKNSAHVIAPAFRAKDKELAEYKRVLGEKDILIKKLIGMVSLPIPLWTTGIANEAFELVKQALALKPFDGKEK